MLNSQPAAPYDGIDDQEIDMMAHTARQRYADIFRDVEKLIDDHSKQLAIEVLEYTLT